VIFPPCASFFFSPLSMKWHRKKKNITQHIQRVHITSISSDIQFYCKIMNQDRYKAIFQCQKEDEPPLPNKILAKLFKVVIGFQYLLMRKYLFWNQITTNYIQVKSTTFEKQQLHSTLQLTCISSPVIPKIISTSFKIYDIKLNSHQAFNRLHLSNLCY
jgi:hypothetical protein